MFSPVLPNCDVAVRFDGAIATCSVRNGTVIWTCPADEDLELWLNTVQQEYKPGSGGHVVSATHEAAQFMIDRLGSGEMLTPAPDAPDTSSGVLA